MCPRTKKQLELVRGETRHAILASALNLFAKNGYNGTTTEAIAKGAGVSKGLIFSYYKTKRDILFGVVDHGMQLVFTGLDPVPSNLSPEARFSKLVDTWIETIRTQPMYIRLLLHLHLHDDFQVLLNERGMEFINLYLNKLREVFNDLGSKNPDLDCYILGAVMDGFSLNYSAAPELFPLDDLARALVDLFVLRGRKG